MLVFKQIRYKNLFSTGNQFNTIDLNKYGSTLITGKNGEGKSTFLDALMFVLFDRPFRNINKPQLVNSINKKNCLVEVDFDVLGNSYVVRRGIKPNVFEILVNGQLLNQDAAVKDYQKVLEQQILKMNAKTFSQVVILGSASFTPFMQLKSGPRREVVEDLLDIRIFSVMSQILKDKVADTKVRLSTVESDINSQRIKIQSQKKIVDTLDQSRKDAVASLRARIVHNNNIIHNTQLQVDRLDDELAVLMSKQQKLEEAIAGLTRIEKIRIKNASAISTCEETMSFFNTNQICPSCSQDIEHDHKHTIIVDLESKLRAHKDKEKQLDELIKKLEAQAAEYKQVSKDIQAKTLEKNSLANTISILNNQNDDLANDISDAGQDTTNLSDEKARLREYADRAINLVSDKQVLLEQRQLEEAASLLLKDTGVKTAIIREYLPVMNRLINKYLTAMDFFVKFELDESFTETIKSRHRDVFSYDSFSEGQKRRIDLAILFTWRQIAKMKNSVNTNLMILDEILDGSLDANGIEMFMTIMNAFGEHTNTFVISHKADQMSERFDHILKVELKNAFSVVSNG